MASGTVTLIRKGSGYLDGRILWESTALGTEANASTLTAKLQIKRSAANSTLGTFKGSFTAGGKNASISSYQSLENSWVTLKTLTVTVSHEPDGSGSCYLYAKVNGPGGTTMEGTYVSGSATVTLDAIPRQAVLTSAADFNDEENPRITYSNPLGQTAESLQAGISLTGENTCEVAYRDVSRTAGTDTLSLTTAERNTLRAAVTGGNSRTVWFYLRTKIGDTYYYSALGKTLTIKDPAPTLSPTVTDSNAATTALTGDSSKLVRYFSNAAVTIGAAAVKQATLVSRKVTCGSKSLTADGTISAVEAGSFVFSATDSRGNTTEKTLTPGFVKYIKLSCGLSGNIPDGEGNMAVQVSGNYFNQSFGAVSNSLAVYYRYKAYGGTYGSWTAMTVTKSGNTYAAAAELSGLDYQTAYVFQAYAKDKLATVYSAEKTVKATPVFDWSGEDFVFHVPVDMDGNRLTGIGDPADTGDAVPLGHADSIYLKKSGGQTLNGSLTIEGSASANHYFAIDSADGYPRLGFRDAEGNTICRVYTVESAHRMHLWEYSPDGSGYSERYRLPLPDNVSANVYYDILTSKTHGTELLWENGSPAESFGAQTVALDLSGCQWVAIEYRFNTEYDYRKTVIGRVGTTVVLDVISQSGYVGTRRAAVSTGGVTFETAYYNGNSGVVGYIIPTAIYGLRGIA